MIKTRVLNFDKNLSFFLLNDNKCEKKIKFYSRFQ
jgi:hypothetical protein